MHNAQWSTKRSGLSDSKANKDYGWWEEHLRAKARVIENMIHPKTLGSAPEEMLKDRSQERWGKWSSWGFQILSFGKRLPRD